MRTLKNIIYIGAILLIAVSCSKEIECKDIYIEPKITLNAICTTDSVFVVEVWASKPIPGYMSNFEFLKDATVKLYTDGSETEQLVYKDTSEFDLSNESIGRETFLLRNAYRSKAKVEVGKNYKIEVSHPKYKTVWSEMTVPQAVPIVKIDTVSTVAGLYYDSPYSYRNLSVNMQVDDPADETNYYRLVVTYVLGRNFGGYYDSDYDSSEDGIDDDIFDNYIGVERFYTGTVIETDDPILAEESEAAYYLYGDDGGIPIFTDELFNGKSHTFEFEISQYGIIDIHHIDTTKGEFYRIYITLQSITEDTYWYLKSLKANDAFISTFLSEPVQIHNNIENGLGIFGSVSSSTYLLEKGGYPLNGYNYTFYDEYW